MQAVIFFQSQLPTFPQNINKDNGKIGKGPYLCNIPRLYYSENISNYICLDAENYMLSKIPEQEKICSIFRNMFIN